MHTYRIYPVFVRASELLWGVVGFRPRLVVLLVQNCSIQWWSKHPVVASQELYSNKGSTVQTRNSAISHYKSWAFGIWNGIFSLTCRPHVPHYEFCTLAVCDCKVWKAKTECLVLFIQLRNAKNNPRAFAQTSKSFCIRVFGYHDICEISIYTDPALHRYLPGWRRTSVFKTNFLSSHSSKGDRILLQLQNGAVFPRHNQQHSVHAFAAQLHLKHTTKSCFPLAENFVLSKKKLENLK